MSVVGYLDGYIDENNNEYGLTDTVAQGAITAIKDGTTIDSFSDVETVISGIKDGTTIDSFGDVETALADKADASDVTAIEGKIPSGASSSNKMATASDVASRVDWESYAKTGVHNLLQFPYKLETNENGGITYTTQSNGSVNLDGTVTATYSETPLFYRTESTPSFYLKKGRYTFSVGDKDGNSITGVTCVIGTTYNGSYKALTEAGSSVSLVIDDNTQCDYKLSDGSCLLAPYIRVANGIQLNNVLVYPLITLDSDTDRTFAPYAMTNQQLTEKVKGIINAATNAADFAAFKTAIGNL